MKHVFLILTLLSILGCPFTLFVGARFAWAWRDGMPPEQGPSSGALAWERFIAHFWPIVLLATLIGTAGFLCYRGYARRLIPQQ
jgi:hypothetical protein